MLDWLSRLLGRRHEAPPRSRATPPVRVACDDRIISVHDEKGSVGTLGWAELARVLVVAYGSGPEADLIWLLCDRDGRRALMVPMGADGERTFLKAMQARLAGFDNMAVVEAMSSTGDGEFQVWPPAETL